MKKKFKLMDLDCANCAAKMEDAIKKIDGVNDATVSFMMQKLTLDADDDRFDEILKELKIDDGFARAIGFNSLEDMKNKVGESVIKSIGYFPEWTILEETDPLNNIVLN